MTFVRGGLTPPVKDNRNGSRSYSEILVKDNRHGWQNRVPKDNRSRGQDWWRTIAVHEKTKSSRTIAMKDKTYERQHHGIEETLLNDSCYCVEVRDIGEERRLGRDDWQPCADHMGRDMKSLGRQRWWWAPWASVTSDRARWGPFSVRWGKGGVLPYIFCASPSPANS